MASRGRLGRSALKLDAVAAKAGFDKTEDFFAAFAREWRLGWIKEQVMRLLSMRIRRLARRRGVTYSFLFMSPSGAQLRELGAHGALPAGLLVAPAALAGPLGNLVGP